MTDTNVPDGYSHLASVEAQYARLLKRAAGWEHTHVPTTDDRTGVGCTSVFGASITAKNVGQQFPLIQGKYVPPRLPFEEIMWMLRGQTNVRPLQQKGVNIWNEWARENGDLGPVYGAQWRGKSDNQRIDQVEEVLSAAVESALSGKINRRMLVDAWTPVDAVSYDTALPPCHFAWQLHLVPGLDHEQVMNMTVYQRSCDVFLGLPFNLAGYGFLLMMLANTISYRLLGAGRPFNVTPKQLTIHLGDAHVYQNHIEQVREYLRGVYNAPGVRPAPGVARWNESPQVTVNEFFTDPGAYQWEDITISGHHPGPKLSAPVAV